MYLLKFYDTKVVEELATRQATEYQPQAVIAYLQERIEWIAVTNNGQNPNLPVETTANTDGEPQQILCMHFSIFFHRTAPFVQQIFCFNSFFFFSQMQRKSAVNFGCGFNGRMATQNMLKQKLQTKSGRHW